MQTFEQKVISQRGDVELASADLKAKQMELEQAKQKLKEVKSNYKKEILDRVSTHEKDILRVSGDIANAQITEKRQIIKAPIDGIVNEQAFHGIGEVIGAGEVILSLVPKNSFLVAEIKLPNKDLAFIHLNQDVNLKIDALPYQKFGKLNGKISAISPSSQQDKEGQVFYSVYIKPDTQILYDGQKEPFPLRSGMTLTADIITRKKNIIEFFTESAQISLEKAFKDPSNK